MLRAFEAGADDFVARAAAYTRAARSPAGDPAPQRRSRAGRLIEVGPLMIDTRAHTVTVDGIDICLRRMEFELLVHLAREPERVFAKDELLQPSGDTAPAARRARSIHHASRLRRKLAPDGSRQWVISVWGVGYRLT